MHTSLQRHHVLNLLVTELIPKREREENLSVGHHRGAIIKFDAVPLVSELRELDFEKSARINVFGFLRICSSRALAFGAVCSSVTRIAQATLRHIEVPSVVEGSVVAGEHALAMSVAVRRA